MRIYFQILLFIFLFAANSSAFSAEVRISKVSGSHNELVYEILRLALSKSLPDMRITEDPEVINEGRMREEVKLGNLDIMWGGTSPSNESELLTVRIPLLKGLLGHRLFIIRKGEQHRYDSVSSLSDLRQLEAGQGRFWGDTSVLKAAGIPVVTSIKYPNLFLMLDGDRFDYFPRAVHEPWDEVASRPELNLTVEKNLMLVYPYAMYFYVNKNNQSLHDHIYQGLEKAIWDGSFDELFFNHPMIRDVLEKANLKQRRVLRIDNPYMHPDTPVERAEFWLDISKL